MQQPTFSFLVPAPRTEPRLTRDEAKTTDPPQRHTLPSRSVRRTPHDRRSRRSEQTRTAADYDKTAAEHPTPTENDPTAQRFAERALRLVLEVLDRRRSAATVAPLLTPQLVGLVNALAAGSLRPGRDLGAARLHKLHLQMADEHRAEIYGTYSRGSRTFAIAGCLTATGSAGWRLSALQL